MHAHPSCHQVIKHVERTGGKPALPLMGAAAAVPQLPVLQAEGGPDPERAVLKELQVEVERLSARLNKGVLPPLPEWGTTKQQQAYV